MSANVIILVFLACFIGTGIAGAIIIHIDTEKEVGKALFEYNVALTIIAILMFIGCGTFNIPDVNEGYYKMVNVKEAIEEYTEETDVMALAVAETNTDIIEIIDGDEEDAIVKIASETFIISKETIATLISNDYLIPCQRTETSTSISTN